MKLVKVGNGFSSLSGMHEVNIPAPHPHTQQSSVPACTSFDNFPAKDGHGVCVYIVQSSTYADTNHIFECTVHYHTRSYYEQYQRILAYQSGVRR